MLNLRRLLLLRDLAELGTVTAVADRRNITSSAVSAQLRVLEDEVGAVLFRRSGRNVRLTASGEILVEHARTIIRDVDAALGAVAATQQRAGGRIAISGFETSIATLAGPLLQRLSSSRPELQVRVIQADSDTSLRALRHGDIDLALVSRLDFRADPPPGGLRSEELLYDPLVVLAPPGLHRHLRALGPRAAEQEPWITGRPETGLAEALVRLGERAGFVPQVTHRVIGAPNMCQLAAAGIGLALVPLLSVPDGLRALVVDGLDVGGRSISALHREGAAGNPAVSSVLRTLREVARERERATRELLSPELEVAS
ncbi:MAG TPA: LysR substrate-binding domain-containing protein [Nocardia sp.]|uniref:LysR family transcriptional regulator n=1 Tax=Nocardia TaxID=1817 RepID=UPI002457C7BA|nr:MULTISPECIES: LysR substrate-binding domain-containing protein [Nocardia]HLS77151.1 LysR substrate-binding domain-containing protein [Nocardia sp.]